MTTYADFGWDDIVIPSLLPVAYYDIAGMVQAVGGRDSDMEGQFSALEISNEMASEFMSGARLIVDHCVIRDSVDALVLRHRKEIKEGDRGFYSPKFIDADFTKLEDRPLEDGLSLLVRIGEDDKNVAIILSGAPRFAVGSDIETLNFFIVQRDDPTKFVAQLDIDLSELFMKGRVVRPLSGNLSRVDVLTLRLFENYRLEIGPTSSDRLELPAAFNDVAAIPRVSSLPEMACLLARVSGDRIKIGLHLGGGIHYDRGVQTVPFVICRDNDPMSAVAFHMVSATDLIGDGVEFPNSIPENDVVIFTPLWYRRTATIIEK